MDAAASVANDEWALPDALPDSELGITGWQSTTYAAMEKVKNDFGGPGKYFEHHFMQHDHNKMMNKAAMSQFADWLHNTFQESPEGFYQTKADNMPCD